MKYEIDKVGEPGRLYIEEEDLLGVAPCKDGTHAAQLTVRYRKQYQAEEAFEWQGTGKNLTLRLVTRQAMDIVEQERSIQTAFCTNCYDYGKVEDAPKDCLRCQLLSACRKAGHGDHRKIRPVGEGGRPRPWLRGGDAPAHSHPGGGRSANGRAPQLRRPHSSSSLRAASGHRETLWRNFVRSVHVALKKAARPDLDVRPGGLAFAVGNRNAPGCT